MKRPVVLLDCDGPLADFHGAYLRAFHEETDLVAPQEGIDRWAIHECTFFVDAAKRLGVEPLELRRRVDRHVLRPGFCDSIEPQPNARVIVKQLMELSDVFVVTSPWNSSVTWMHERHQWLVRKLAIPRGHIIQTGRKHLIRGDVFVDDKPSHVEEWAHQWPNGRAVLFDMPHNRSEGSSRRGSWPEVLDALLVLQEVRARSERPSA
jgi:5'(3')-deoxyribonucleotidase